MDRTKDVSPELEKFLAGLTAEQREGLIAVLRDPQTYIAEDVTDLIAILRDIGA